MNTVDSKTRQSAHMYTVLLMEIIPSFNYHSNGTMGSRKDEEKLHILNTSLESPGGGHGVLKIFALDLRWFLDEKLLDVDPWNAGIRGSKLCAREYSWKSC